jgi:hypothetical protein
MAMTLARFIASLVIDSTLGMQEIGNALRPIESASEASSASSSAPTERNSKAASLEETNGKAASAPSFAPTKPNGRLASPVETNGFAKQAAPVAEQPKESSMSKESSFAQSSRAEADRLADIAKESFFGKQLRSLCQTTRILKDLVRTP